MASLCARGIITPALAPMQPFSAKSIGRNKFLLGTHLLHLGRERQLWTKCLVYRGRTQRVGFEPTTFWLQVESTNHYTTVLALQKIWGASMSVNAISICDKVYKWSPERNCTSKASLSPSKFFVKKDKWPDLHTYCTTLFSPHRQLCLNKPHAWWFIRW